MATLLGAVLGLAPLAASAQSTALLRGHVVDQTGAVVPSATIEVTSLATGIHRIIPTDAHGEYQVADLPVGEYRIEVRKPGFPTQIVESFQLEVARTIVRDFELRVGSMEEAVEVRASAPLLDLGTISVGQNIDQRTVQTMPLNGRYFLDLGVLGLGSVTASTTGFSTTPSRGLGALAINTAGSREDAVNYIVNGVTLNNFAFNSISFQPSIATVQEFRIDNSTFSAEYGQNSGAIVNIATRSGTNAFDGEVFGFLRDDAFDARNFFNFTSSQPELFTRHQYGADVGGPIVRNRTFFFSSYEGLRQKQGVNLNSVVAGDASRAAVTDPVVAKLVELIPRSNFTDSQGTPRYVGVTVAPTSSDQVAIDISHRLTENGQLHGFYARQSAEIDEPTRQGNTVPGFGHVYNVHRFILTLNERHSFGSTTANEVRFGLNGLDGTVAALARLNPADYGIRSGVTQPIGLPQISIAGGSLNLGGPANFPQGRTDTTVLVGDTASHLRGNHSIKLGGQFSLFASENAARDTGRFNFASVEDFLAGNANAFNVTLGDRTSHITQRALGVFAQDQYKWRPDLTIEAGLRYEWNITPIERDNRFIVFDPASVSLVRVGRDLDEIYQSNNRNFEPRVGLIWDPAADGRTTIRGAYATAVDEPETSVVSGTAGNPPLAMPLTFAGPIGFGNAVNRARAAGLAPQTVDHRYQNPMLRSWNVNVQRELTRSLAAMVGYFGSKGRNLRLARNINQPVNGVRPFPALSASSPILPGTALGNITQIESSGQSSYHGLWVTATQRLARGLQFNASYVWSSCHDEISLSAQGVALQNSYDVRGNRGLSDFNATHRAVVNATYELPFHGNAFLDGWQVAVIVQAQSGNPINIVTSNSTVNGVPNTLRPDVTGPVRITGTVEQWFDTSTFVEVDGFGNLPRNVIIGPRFDNTDIALIKHVAVGRQSRVQVRIECFNLFNHPNFSQPGTVVGTPSFGRITSTRFPTGESGSARQVQFAVKVGF